MTTRFDFKSFTRRVDGGSIDTSDTTLVSPYEFIAAMTNGKPDYITTRYMVVMMSPEDLIGWAETARARLLDTFDAEDLDDTVWEVRHYLEDKAALWESGRARREAEARYEYHRENDTLDTY